MNPRSSRYDRAIRELGARLDRFERDNRNRRQPNLGFSTIQGGAIKAATEFDDLRMIIGDQYDGTSTSAVVAGPVPPTPTAPMVTPIISGLRIYWDGTFDDAQVAPMDWARVTVHAMPESSPDPLEPGDQRFIVGEIVTATGGEVTASLPIEEHVVVLFAWSQAGKPSLMSGGAVATPALVDIPDISDAINEAIENAEATASAALVAANGKNRLYFQPLAPDGPNVVGDTWFDTDFGNRISRWDGSAWVPELLSTQSIANLAITNALIANLDAAKINAGVLDAARIGANSIDTTKLTVSDLSNYAGDGNFSRPNSWGSATILNGAPTNVPNYMRITSTAGTQKVETSAYSFQAVIGESYFISGQYMVSATGGNTSILEIALTVRRPDGTTARVSSFIPASETGASRGTWKDFGAVITIPTGTQVTSARVTLGIDSTAPAATGVDHHFRNINARKRGGGELIVDGGIKAINIAADAIDGKVITGATMRTAASGQRTQFDVFGLRTFDASDSVTASLSAGTGSLTLTGNVTGGTFTGTTFRTAASGERVVLNSTDGFTAYNTNGILVAKIDEGMMHFTAPAPPPAPPGTYGSELRVGTGVGWESQVYVGTGLSWLIPGTTYTLASIISFYDQTTLDGRIGIEAGDVTVSATSGNATLAMEEYQISVGVRGDAPIEMYAMDTSFGGIRSTASWFSVDVLDPITEARTVEFALGTNIVLNSAGDVFLRQSGVNRLHFAGGLLRLPIVNAATTTTAAANLFINSTAHNVARSTSMRAAKLAIENIPMSEVEALLDVDVVTWFDRQSSENYADSILADDEEGQALMDDMTAPLERIPGVVAEDVDEKAPRFATRDSDGALTGVAYDRIGVAWIPLVRDLRAENTSLWATVADLRRDLDALRQSA